jgi:hypothetical protein
MPITNPWSVAIFDQAEFHCLLTFQGGTIIGIVFELDHTIDSLEFKLYYANDVFQSPIKQQWFGARTSQLGILSIS